MKVNANELFNFLIKMMLYFQADFIPMMLVTWGPAVRNVQMVRLLHSIKHQELGLKIASLVPKVNLCRYIALAVTILCQGAVTLRCIFIPQ